MDFDFGDNRCGLGGVAVVADLHVLAIELHRVLRGLPLRSETKSAGSHKDLSLAKIPSGRNLPMRAEVAKPGGTGLRVGRRVMIVQAEVTDGRHVTLGVLNGDEQLVLALEGVKLLE